MNIETLYTSMLSSFYGISIDDEGYVSLNDGTGLIPYTIEGRRVVIPVKARLRAGITNEMVAFHPLCEAVPRTTSPVIKAVTNLANFTATVAATQLLGRLIEVAVKATATKKQLKLTVQQTELLTAVGDMGAGIVAEWDKLELDPFDGNLIARWYLKKAGEWKGNRYSQVAVFSSEFYEALCESDCTLMKTKKNIVAVKGLMEWVFPGIADANTYSYGSSTHIATRFHALMSAFAAFVGRINQLNTMFSDVFAKLYGEAYSLDDDLIDLSWESELDNLRAYMDLIPPMPGNICGEDFKIGTKAPAPVRETATNGPAPAVIPSTAMETPRVRSLKDFAPTTPAMVPGMPMGNMPGMPMGNMPGMPVPGMPMGMPGMPAMPVQQGPQYVQGADGHTYIQYPNGQIVPLTSLSSPAPAPQMMPQAGSVYNPMMPQTGMAPQMVQGTDGMMYLRYPNGQFVPMPQQRQDTGPVSFGNPTRR